MAALVIIGLMTEIIDDDALDAKGRPESEAERDDRRGVARLEAFSDGVFAIAITLLVLGIEVPDVDNGQLNDAIGDLVGSIEGYFVGFAVIGLFWVNHHQFFGRVERHDGRLLWMNLLFLSLISMMPFSTGLIGDYGGERDAVIVFAVNVGLAASALILTERSAVRSRLLGPDSPYYHVSFPRWQAWITPAIFFGSAGLAFIDPSLAQLSWILTLVASIALDRTGNDPYRS